MTRAAHLPGCWAVASDDHGGSVIITAPNGHRMVVAEGQLGGVIMHDPGYGDDPDVANWSMEVVPTSDRSRVSRVYVGFGVLGSRVLVARAEDQLMIIPPGSDGESS